MGLKKLFGFLYEPNCVSVRDVWGVLTVVAVPL